MKNIDELAGAALWFKKLKETSNEAFIPLFADEHRYLVLMGGGGSGKSIFAGRKITERCVSEKGHRALVVRKVAKTLRESCFKQLAGQISEYYPDSGVKVNRSDMVIAFGNGSEIIFAGLDDVEKLKSIYNITMIWIEEASEITEYDFNQLDIRLRGETQYYKQIIITFNPISILHWLKIRFFDKSDPRATTHRSTYRDNRFLDAESVQTLEAFKVTDEYYYTVYCLGMWGVLGKPVFDAKAVTERLSKLPEYDRGIFEYTDDMKTIKFVKDEKGPVKIFTEVKPGRPYVIGGDTAGDGSDRFTAYVIDNATGKQVASMRYAGSAEDLYARQIYCLGKYYNDALVSVEANYSTYPVRELERLGYTHQYVREKIDDYTHNIVKSFGFRTDMKSRPVAIANLIKYARDNLSDICDEWMLEEMLTFSRNEEYRAEAEAGAHDDMIMAAAICLISREQQTYIAEVKVTREWTQDMIDDYMNSDEDGRKYLESKWGTPRL